MSGIVSFTIGIAEYFRKQKKEATIFCVIAGLFLIVAFDQAWQDEHRNGTILIGEKNTLGVERDFWKAQFYSANSTLQTRDNLLAQNYGALTAEQDSANKAQGSLATLSQKILEINKVPKMKWEALALESSEPVSSNPAMLKSRWLLLTNKSQSPAQFKFSCASPIISAEAKIAGSAADARTFPLDDKQWGAKIMSPAWSPDSPVLIVMTTSAKTNTEHLNCSFTLESTTD
jgi:hypothetical protein